MASQDDQEVTQDDEDKKKRKAQAAAQAVQSPDSVSAPSVVASPPAVPPAVPSAVPNPLTVGSVFDIGGGGWGTPMNPKIGDMASVAKQGAAEAYRNLPFVATPEQRAQALADYKATVQYKPPTTTAAVPWGPSVDHYNEWLIRQGINPTTIGGAKLVGGMMDVPSIAQQTQAAQTMGQVHARRADLMHAAAKTNRSNPTLSAKLKDAARNIFPQTTSYENTLRGYLDLILPDAMKSTAGLEQYLPSLPGYRQVVSPGQIPTPEDIAQQHADSLKTVRKPPKQKRGQEEEEEET